jgi:hypothetical protein
VSIRLERIVRLFCGASNDKKKTHQLQVAREKTMAQGILSYEHHGELHRVPWIVYRVDWTWDYGTVGLEKRSRSSRSGRCVELKANASGKQVAASQPAMSKTVDGNYASPHCSLEFVCHTLPDSVHAGCQFLRLLLIADLSVLRG